MSKLSHSNDETMNQIEERRMLEDGFSAEEIKLAKEGLYMQHRINTEDWTPAEWAIHNAIQEVERLGAHDLW